MTRVLVTGASGFIGHALVPTLLKRGHQVRALASPRSGRVSGQAAGSGSPVDWRTADLCRTESLPAELCSGVDVVVHLAALAHVPRGTLSRAESLLHQTNVAAALALAENAATAGVRRFLFVSSALVHGDQTTRDAWTEESALAPVELYGTSKAQAEADLHGFCDPGELELTVIRPPLVYGPGAKGNFAKLLAWAVAGRPVPSAVRSNRRSFVGLSNLCSLLAAAVDHPAAADQTFLVSDQEDLSTGELYRRAALQADARPRFLPLPRGPLALALRLAGRAAVARRLLGDFRIDSTKASNQLGWRPVSSIEAELGRAVHWFRHSGERIERP